MSDKALSMLIAVAEGKLLPTTSQKDMIRGYLARFVSGSPVQVNFSPPSRGRTTKQNGYYWGVVLSMIATETGHTSEECHEYFKSLLLPRMFVTIAGKERSVPKSTTELTTVEMEQYLERIRAFAAAELRMNVPLPGEV